MGRLADVCHAMLPGMMARGEDRIISLASTAGLMGYPYVSAQRALALGTARTGVTVLS